MELGVHIGYWGLGLTSEDQLKIVQEAERLGYDSVWAAEAYGSDTATVLGWLAGQTSKIRLGSDGARFLLILLKVITIFSPLRLFVPASLAMFFLGAGYAAWTVIAYSHVTNSSVLLILASILIFLIGLVSEQIASLRSEGRRS